MSHLKHGRKQPFKLDLSTAWYDGRASGYPACCRAHFMVRGWLANRVGWDLFDRAHHFMERYEFYRRLMHKLCPGHLLAAAVGLYRPRYGYCKPCGWTQLLSRRGDPCYKCLKQLTRRQVESHGVRLPDGRTFWVRREVNRHDGDLDA